MVWMNVDKVFRKCVIHQEECPWISWVHTEDKPQFKGIGELKRDGGWFRFASPEEAENCWKQEWQPKGYVISRDGCRCHRFL